MTDLTGGYRANGTGNTAILAAILARPAITWKGPALTLPQELFTKNFMPYAKRHWAYEASRCNCEHLARAFQATWNFACFKRKSSNYKEKLLKAEVRTCGHAMITRALRVFNGPARGNVRNPATASLDGRCLFPVHYLCKIGARHFDPTFDRGTNVRGDCAEREIKRLGLDLWIDYKDKTRIYVRNLTPAPGFADSWNEFHANQWITHADWKGLTALTGHFRSAELRAVDSALKTYEDSKNPMNLSALKTAFQKWYVKKKSEVAHRNKQSCIYRLALNLGLAATLLK